MDILERANIEIEFSYGDWKGMAEEVKAEWDLVLTAETIYREESVESLISCLKQAAAPSHVDDAAVEPGAETGSKVVEVEGQVDAVKTVDNEDQDQDNNDVTPWKEGEQVTLVAAKVSRKRNPPAQVTILSTSFGNHRLGSEFTNHLHFLLVFGSLSRI